MSSSPQMPGAFAPERIRSISGAYRSALETLEFRPQLKNGMADQIARVELAKAMMRLALEGEKDEAVLREKALLHLATMSGPAQ